MNTNLEKKCVSPGLCLLCNVRYASRPRRESSMVLSIWREKAFCLALLAASRPRFTPCGIPKVHESLLPKSVLSRSARPQAWTTGSKYPLATSATSRRLRRKKIPKKQKDDKKDEDDDEEEGEQEDDPTSKCKAPSKSKMRGGDLCFYVFTSSASPAH